MALVSTIGGSDANTYASLAYASAYFQSRLGSDDWNKADSSDRESALIQSATILDRLFDWVGDKATDTQALRWPREWAEDLDGIDIPSTIIPESVLKAQCELAISLLASGGYLGESRSIDRLNIGSIKLDFDNTASALPIPNVIVEMLRGLGSYRGTGKSGSISVPLYRV